MTQMQGQIVGGGSDLLDGQPLEAVHQIRAQVLRRAVGRQVDVAVELQILAYHEQRKASSADSGGDE